MLREIGNMEYNFDRMGECLHTKGIEHSIIEHILVLK